MRLLVINCVLMACTTAALAEGLRPRRDLHQIKKMIVNKLLSSSEPSGAHTDPFQTKFFKIPGFNEVVIKAVPKGSIPEPTTVYEELPPDSHLGIVGSYLGTRTLNETYNALLGVKNLLTSGILSGKPELLQEVGSIPSKIQVIAKPVKPCVAPGLSPVPLKPIRVFVEPPRVSGVPTQYSSKQVNQDGSLMTYSSYLDLENGVRVIHDGKTLPFFIDRVRKIPVRLPVPVLPDVSKIIVSEALHPATYSYQQIHQDGRMTSHLGLPSLIRPPGPVIVTETGARIFPPPIFIMDRIEKVAAIASYPKAPIPVAPTPVEMNAAVAEGGSVSVPGPTGYSYSQMDINGGMTTHSDSGVQTMNAADVGGASAPVPGPTGYLYSQMDINGGMTTHSDSGVQTMNAADVGGASAPVPGPTGYSYSQMDINGGMTTHSDSGVQTMNAADVGGASAPVPGPTGYSYSQMDINGGVTTHSASENGLPTVPLNAPSVPKRTSFEDVSEPMNVVEHKPIPVSTGKPFPPYWFSYKQIGNGKMTTYTGSGVFEESFGARPAVIAHGMAHPIPPPHMPSLMRPPGPVILTETGSRIPPPPIFLMDRIEKVAAIASYPKAPIPVAPTPVAMNAAVAEGGSVSVPGPTGYSYSQMDINGGMTTHSDSGVQTMNAADVGGASAPVPGPTGYSYSQMDINGGMTTHSDSGVQTMNAADLGGASAPVPGPTRYSYSQMDINGGMTTHSDSGVQTMNTADVGGASAPVPGPTGYSYSQMDINGGMPTHSDSGVQTMNTADVGGASALVPGPTGYSYSQMDINGGMTMHSASDNGLPTVPLNAPSVPTRANFEDIPEPVNVVEHKPIPFPPNWFSYKQIGNGKMTTNTGSGIFEESFGARPAVIVHGMAHPIPPPHITARIEKVAAGAIYNQPPYLTMPVVVPVPTGFVSVPSGHTIHPQRPVKVPTTPRNSFLYKHVHRNGSVTSYGSDGSTAANMKMPLPQSKVFNSPMDSGPFPMNPVNLNAIKPSTPVSGSYSYKLVNSDQRSYPPVGPIDGLIVDTFAPPSPTSMPSHIQGCMDPDIFNPVAHIDSPDASVPLSYSYKQISHSNLDPFLKVNVDDPKRGGQNANMGLSQNNQAYPSLPPLTPPTNPFPTVNIVEHKPIGFVNPAPFWSAPIMKMPVPQGPTETSQPSSFSYKQVTNHAYQPLQVPSQPSAVMEYNPSAPSQKSDMPLPQASKRSSPPSSFSYNQVTSQAYQPLPSPPQPTINDMERRLSGPSVPPPMINNRGPEIQKDNAPSSFSYKQVTREGVYEYSDEFPTGAKTNLPPNAPQTIATPMPESPMPIPSRPTPSFNRQDYLANNPIAIQDSSSGSSFSYKTANSDGSTITVKNDGQNSIAVQVEEAAKTEAVSQELTDLPRMAPVLKESVTTPAPEETAGPVSEQARPLLRRVVKRVKPVNHRGDIPDDE